MGWFEGAPLAILLFAAMLALMVLRVPVALAMFGAGAVGYVMEIGWIPLIQHLKTLPYGLFSNYTLTVVPLFVLMGSLAARAGLSQSLFEATNAWLGHRRGGLAMATIGACAAFGAICGSSVATAATFARAALPQMRRFGYAGSLATGTVAVGGTLGILIPPSVILVVYGISTEQNIAKLFMAAMIPGVLATLFYCAAIAVTVRIQPELAPQAPAAGWSKRFKSLIAVTPIGLIFLIVIGGIYGGVFTPTEGAAVGAGLTFGLCLIQRALSWDDLRESFFETAQTTAMIFMILLGADLFNSVLAVTQMPAAVANWVTGLGVAPLMVVVIIMAVYILLGSVMDELAMILLTLPVFFPMVMGLDFGMPAEDVAIWFGILVLVVVGFGLCAPPVGLNVYVINAIARDVPMIETFKGVMPFLATDIVRLILLVMFPGLSLWLVRLLN